MSSAISSLDSYFLRSFAGSILVLAALLKLHSSDDLRRFLGLLGIPPDRSQLLARLTGWFELSAGAFLLSGALPILTASVAALLAGSFITAQLVLRKRDAVGSCGCFGAAEVHADPHLDFFRAGTFLLLALLAFAATAVGSGDTNPGSTSGVLAAFSGASFVIGFLLIGQVRSFGRWRPEPVSWGTPVEAN